MATQALNEIRRAPRAARNLGLGILICLAACGPAASQTSSEMRQILDRLQRLEEENRQLAEEVHALRDELAGRRQEQDSKVDERLQVQEARTAELAQTKVEASQRFPIRITGMALFNTFFNAGQSGGSEYPTVAAPGSQNSGGATFRQTILGLEYRGPQAFANGKVHGTLQMDLFGGTGRLLDQTVRLRTASLGIDWKTRNVLAGLEKPIISPREPNSLAQVGVSPLTGAGNLWLWIPQVRFEQDFRLGEQTGVRAQIGAVQTREALGYTATSAYFPPSYTPALEASRPGLEGRFEFFHDADRRIEIAPGFHRSVSHVEETSVPSNIFSLDWLASPWQPLEFTGAFFAGQNVSPLGTGGIRQGFVVLGPGRARAIHSRGGWAQLTYRTTPRLSFNLFSGQQDDRNSDLEAGRIGKNLLYGANFFYRIAPNVMVSFEASQTRTVYIGTGVLRNNHYDLALAYLF